MPPIFTIPQLLEREYAGFLAMTASAPVRFGLPATYDGWTALMAGQRRQHVNRGNDVRDIPISLAEFSAYCEREKDSKPTVVTLERCCREIADRMFPDAKVI